MAAGVTVRTAEPGDVDGIGTVHVLAWQQAYIADLPASFLAGMSVVDKRRVWRERLADATTQMLVALDAGAVVGFAAFDTTGSEGGHLGALYMHPDWWGQGIGKTLHGAVLTSMREAGCARSTLWVPESNARARSFYEALGWATDGTTQVDPIAGSPPLSEVRYAIAL